MWKTTVYLLSLRFPKDRLAAVANHAFGSLLFYEWEKFPEAKKALRLSLQIESDLNPNSEDVILISTNLGRILSDAGKDSDAALVLTQAVESGQKHFPRQKRTYTAQSFLSPVNWKLGKRREAVDLMTVCCTGLLQDYPLSKITAYAFLVFSSFAEVGKDYETAETRLKIALSILTTHSDIHRIEECIEAFRSLYQDMGTENAMEQLLKDEQVKARQRDPTSLVSKILQRALNFYYRGIDDYAQIELAYKEELEVCRAHDVASEYGFEIVQQLADMYEDQEREAEAEALYIEAVAIGRTQDPIPIAAFTLMRKLADLYDDDDRTSEAEALFNEAFSKSKAINSASECTITALKDLADFYQSQGRSSEAETAYIETIEKVRSDPTAKKALTDLLNNLEELYEKQNRTIERAVVCKELYESSREKNPVSTPTNREMYKLLRIYKELGWDSEAERLLKRSMYTAQAYDPALYDFIVDLTGKFPPPGIDEANFFSDLETFYEETSRCAEAEYCYIQTAQNPSITSVCLIHMKEVRKLYSGRDWDVGFRIGRFR